MKPGGVHLLGILMIGVEAGDAAAVADHRQESQVLGDLHLCDRPRVKSSTGLPPLNPLYAIDGMPLQAVKPYSRILRRLLLNICWL